MTDYVRIVETCDKCGKEIRRSSIFQDSPQARGNMLTFGALSGKNFTCCGKTVPEFVEMGMGEIIHEANRVPNLERTITNLQKMLNERDAA